MRQLNLFFYYTIIFLCTLLLSSLLYVIYFDKIAFFLMNAQPDLLSLIKLIGLKIYLYHQEFVIFSMFIGAVILYSFLDISYYRSRHYISLFIFTPLIISVFLFYFENYIFPKTIDESVVLKQEQKILNNIDYRKFFHSKFIFYKINNEALKFFIVKKNRRNATGYYVYKNNFLYLNNFKLNFRSNKLIITPLFLKNYTATKYVINNINIKQKNIWGSIKFPINKIYYFAFIIFIIIPFSLLFNNRGWYLKTIIFLSIFLPLLLIVFHYYNNLVLNLLKKVKNIPDFPYTNDFIVSITYILLGKFIFNFVDKIRNLRPRIDIAKVKRIQH